MEQILLPSKIEFTADKENKNKGTLDIEPCYPGYGTTIGNTLRRVLLSSLPGAAVMAVKIKGVQHEFMGIPGVQEDVIEVILNLKQLRLKVFSEESVVLTLEVKGEKEVKAKDIQTSSDVEIVNPDLKIATLTDKKAELHMKIWVGRGRGYVPVEERREEIYEPGVIAIDSIFSPILKVGFHLDNVRVLERTDYDKLTMEIETDGTISAQEAIVDSTNILLDHFKLIVDEMGRAKKIKEEKESEKAEEKKESKKSGKKEVKKKPVKAKAEKKSVRKETKKKAVKKLKK